MDQFQRYVSVRGKILQKSYIEPLTIFQKRNNNPAGEFIPQNKSGLHSQWRGKNTWELKKSPELLHPDNYSNAPSLNDASACALLSLA